MGLRIAMVCRNADNGCPAAFQGFGFDELSETAEDLVEAIKGLGWTFDGDPLDDDTPTMCGACSKNEVK